MLQYQHGSGYEEANTLSHLGAQGEVFHGCSETVVLPGQYLKSLIYISIYLVKGNHNHPLAVSLPQNSLLVRPI